jgi:hypothetical protein
MLINRMFHGLVISYYTIDIYDIIIIQDHDGQLISLRIEEYDE